MRMMQYQNRRRTIPGIGALLALLSGTLPAEEPSETPTTDPGTDPSPIAGEPIGWAAENGGTTGGAAGETITVTSGDELAAEMAAEGARTIEVQGSVELDGMNDVASDKTITGANAEATITGGGIDVDEATNVIIQNLNFADWGDDAINLQEGSTNVWIDHNSFTGGDDGAVDIKRESDFVTVSWNHVFEHDKSMLLGHSDDHTADLGHLRVTYHHNFFDGSDTRHPRVRFGETVHVFNNYYRDNEEYGVASTMDAGVLVEGNYFENVDTPTEVGYGSSGPGRLVANDNVVDNSGQITTEGDVAPVPYDYSLDNAEEIPDIVSQGAGPR